jgi:hypothetical protein
VVDLHGEGFGRQAPRQNVEDFLGEIFFRHPWLDETLPSLGYVDPTGKLVGCLGVMPRPMVLDGQPVRAVVTHNFVVTPGQRAGLAAIQLMRSLMACKPDLTIADGNETAREISEALGGTTFLPRSGRWLRVLRPAGLAVYMLDARPDGRKLPSYVNRALTGLSVGPDAVARTFPGSPTYLRAVEGPDADLDEDMLLLLIERYTRHLSLRPTYTRGDLAWLLGKLQGTRRDQRLRACVVRQAGDDVGWYVYYSRPGQVGRVLQMGAAPLAQEQVLDHLFADAVREGNVGLSGQSDPAWTASLEGAGCRARSGSTWLIVSSSLPRVRQALAGSDAFLSRLEGEAWLHFAF